MNSMDPTIKKYLVQIVLENERPNLAYSNTCYCLRVSMRVYEAAIIKITYDDHSHYNETVL